MKAPFFDRARLNVAAGLLWVANKIMPAVIRPIFHATLQLCDETALAYASSTDFGILTAAWSRGDDHNTQHATEMASRVKQSIAYIRNDIEGREFQAEANRKLAESQAP